MMEDSFSDKIATVNRKIEEVEANIAEAERRFLDKDCNDNEYWNQQEKQLRRKEEQLRDEKKQLRDEKKQLRDEKKQLRDEKKQLRELELEKEKRRTGKCVLYSYLSHLLIPHPACPCFIEITHILVSLISFLPLACCFL
jgi:hypothetical protein